MDNKLSELKYALECLEGAQYDGEWNSALVGGGGDGAEYPAVTNLAGIVVRTARLGPHEARLCEYLKAVSPSNIRALLAELEVVKAENALFRETGDYLIQAAYCAQERATAAEAKLEASRKSNAFLKEQLSQLANFNPDWDMLEACRESWREVSAALKEAETRLATPVRLSKTTHPRCRQQHASDIRAAGFIVEGDE